MMQHDIATVKGKGNNDAAKAPEGAAAKKTPSDEEIKTMLEGAIKKAGDNTDPKADSSTTNSPEETDAEQGLKLARTNQVILLGILKTLIEQATGPMANVMNNIFQFAGMSTPNQVDANGNPVKGSSFGGLNVPGDNLITDALASFIPGMKSDETGNKTD